MTLFLLHAFLAEPIAFSAFFSTLFPNCDKAADNDGRLSLLFFWTGRKARLELNALQMPPIFVLLALLVIIKLVIHVLHVKFVVLGLEKLMLVLQLLIGSVLKMFVTVQQN